MDIRAHVICVGNEILLGHISNTNAEYISRKLSSIGVKTSRHISVPDEEDTIIHAIRESLCNSDIAVLTGGLGPTVDDITLECISKALGRKLIPRKKVAEHIKNNFKKRNLSMPKNNLRQALIPEGALPVLNNIGTAPGLIIPVQGKTLDRKVLVALPGVPFEMHAMLDKAIIPFLKKTFKPGVTIKSRVIKITGLPESRVNEKIRDILNIKGNVQMGIYPHPEEITVKITVTEKNEKLADASIVKIEKKISSRLKKHIFAYDNEKLEEIIGNLLVRAKKSIALAESCTGGLLANRITDIPGSSRYFKMGVVTYSDESKNKLVSVPAGIIKKYGAVSKQAARLMAKNIRLKAGSDIGIGISGIAGPGGGTAKKPVGLVYIALSSKTKTICGKFRFLGQRRIIKYKTTQAALNMIRLYLLRK
ncbi:MAG: competence/damage-inducible protein A [Candidatus Omnitrophica bacterium]|nr:competence/damage-inducible protein A [Candidatus Omnitrophota bacterium]MBU1932612.1 competence/damage-inducible protein A [Candidatus Omnitrophota bacterium]